MSVSTQELEATLEAGGVSVQDLKRRPSKYETSFPLEDVDVTLVGGSTLALVLKELSPEALPDRARAAKPSFLADPERELDVYERMLAGVGLGTATCHAAVRDPDRARYWLLIERVEGVPLWQIGELERWGAAARWLAGLHQRFAARDGDGWRAGADRLLHYDSDLYRVWARRAREHSTRAGLKRRDRDRVAAVADRYEAVIERLTALPATFIHGEFYASNVIVGRSPASGRTGLEGVRICPIDWELAAEGPGLIDLAALTTGGWSQPERREIASAYVEALAEPPRSGAEFDEALDCCRLHLAVQWLGWAPGWKPPRAHRHDWLGEALELVERLGL